MSIDVWPSGVVTNTTDKLCLSRQTLGDTRYPKVPVFWHNEGDTRIQDLFAKYSTDASLVNNTSFKLDVIDVVIDLYGAFPRFLSYQFDDNYLMHGLNLEFLKDTLNYIATGSRDYSLVTWRELVERNPDYIVRKNTRWAWRNIKSEFGIKNDTDLKHYISMWCSHTGGFEDMLYTTWILFGSPVGAKALID